MLHGWSRDTSNDNVMLEVHYYYYYYYYYYLLLLLTLLILLLLIPCADWIAHVV